MTQSRLRKIERHAGQIHSPIARLRFLQETMNQPLWRARKSRILTAFAGSWLLFTLPPLVRPVPAIDAVFRPPAATPQPASANVRLEATKAVWQIEKTDAFETYSNGLRIDNRFSVAGHPRSYVVFSATKPENMRSERRSRPAGIVFHTTESLQVPFEAGKDSALKRAGASLLAYVRHKKAYNFVIDRFGRVYRVVQESDAANHAGNSVWSDPEWIYVNLNQSFIGVSFEARTLPGQTEATVNPSQIWSAALLTQMLRQRYGIPAGNCVTHAQVSVNASSMEIGYHMDWASSFPFDQVGLPDNYALPLPDVYLFGFEYDSSFTRRAGERLQQEAQISEQVLREHATEASLPVPAYKKALRERYQKLLAIVREGRDERNDQEEELRE